MPLHYSQEQSSSCRIIPRMILFWCSTLYCAYVEVQVDTVCTEQSSFEQPFANLRELEHRGLKMDSMSKRIQSIEDQFVDGNWKLLKTGSGRQAIGKSYYSKSGHLQDGHCWEVSMSMMNESARKCAMMARLEEQQRPLSKKPVACSQAVSRDMKRMVFRKLRLFTSKKSQPKKTHLPERRRTT